MRTDLNFHLLPFHFNLALVMPWTIDFLEAEKIILVKTSGSLDLGAFKRLAAESLAEAARLGVTCFLLDHRSMTPAVDAIEIYNMPRINEELGVTRQHRVAIVYDPESSDRSNFQFYEDRASNIGFDHRLFIGVAEAMKWLAAASRR